MNYEQRYLVDEFIKIRVYMINNFMLCSNLQKIDIPESLIPYKNYIKEQIELKTNVEIKTNSVILF